MQLEDVSGKGWPMGRAEFLGGKKESLATEELSLSASELEPWAQ